MSAIGFNRTGVWAIYRFEMARFVRTLLQSVVTPVITTSLYFVVFGSAIGSRMSRVGGVPYGARAGHRNPRPVTSPRSVARAARGTVGVSVACRITSTPRSPPSP